MNLWLDDVRPAPEGWTHVKTADEAIALLATGNVDTCSLDHDLADKSGREKTGYDVVMWMAETGEWPRVVHVHSMNPVGRASMLAAIRRYKPEAT